MRFNQGESVDKCAGYIIHLNSPRGSNSLIAGYKHQIKATNVLITIVLYNIPTDIFFLIISNKLSKYT